MNDKRDFDRAVDRWLNDGSDATPPEVIDAVLLAARSTPQERDFRGPWRTTSMTSYLRVAAVIALVVIGSTAAMFTLRPGRVRRNERHAIAEPNARERAGRARAVPLPRRRGDFRRGPALAHHVPTIGRPRSWAASDAARRASSPCSRSWPTL